MQDKTNEYYCEYCQEQNLKYYIVNLLGDVFCNDYCHEQMKQFYRGKYEIVESKLNGVNKNARWWSVKSKTIRSR